MTDLAPAAEPERPSRWRRSAALFGGARKDILLSFLDQGFNSLHSLVLALVLIAWGEPATYGVFAFIVTTVLIASSLQYGLIGIPILVHLRARDAEQREAGMKTLAAMDVWIRLVAACATGIGALLASGSVGVGAAAAAFCGTYLLRETTRNGFYSQGRTAAAARLAVTALALVIPLYWLLLAAADPLLAPLVASTLATGTALALQGGLRFSRPKSPIRAYRAYRSEFPGTGWSFVNSAANEVQMKLHVFVIFLARGADQLGLIEAGRILLSPLFLIVSAWQRVAQPRITSLVEAGDLAGAKALTFAGVALVVGVAATWCATIYLGWSLVERYLFSGFGDVGVYVVGWSFYSILIISNWSLIVFLNALQQFRKAAFVTVSAASATAVLLCIMLFDVPLVTALYILAAVQGATFAWLLGTVLLARPPTDRQA